MGIRSIRLVLVLSLSCLIQATMQAEVVRVEISARRDLAAGKGYGLAGPFEKLEGRLFFAVDPANSANRVIADIDKAPRNVAGQVEFSADFFLIKLKRAERGNGTLLFEVSNRGGKGMISFFNRGARGGANPESEADLGDGFLLRQGFTLLWVGWQFDPPRREGLMRDYPPIASDGGRPIRGLVRSDFVVATRSFDQSLADREHIAYPVADPEDPANRLTVRDSVEGPRRILPRSQWRFARREGERVIDDPTRVYLTGGFEPYKIYEVVYVAQNPPLVGCGMAAIRDAISYLKYGAPESLSISAATMQRAVGFGISQSGRFLRTFLYYGFNEDEGHRKVFDGVLAHVAGGGRGSFNHRFAQPSRDAHPYMNFFYPTDIFPFTDTPQADPETGIRDGLLTHAGKPELLPKIFYTNSSYEYWGRAASLIHTTLDGQKDMPLPDNVRIYLFAGGQHGPAAFPPRQSIGQQRNNPNDYRWFMRSLLLAMNRWVSENASPPPSRYPRVDQGTLVPPEQLRFPKLPGVGMPGGWHQAYRADYGPQFLTQGIVTQEPPKLGSAYPISVPQVDADGNETAGLKMPELAVPLATYTGWNLFAAPAGPVEVLSSMQGSYIPFARTRAEREQGGDPRPAIEERYQNRDYYLGMVAQAALELIAQGYLLDQDLPEILRQAGRHWDTLLPKTSKAAKATG